MWLIFLSEQLSVIGLVSRYLTNYLIERRLLLKRILSNPLLSRAHAVLANLSVRCSPLQGRSLRVTHPFATRILVLLLRSPFDLHALGTPPAFILSQDQTLRLIIHLFLLKSGFVYCTCIQTRGYPERYPTQALSHFLFHSLTVKVRWDKNPCDYDHRHRPKIFFAFGAKKSAGRECYPLHPAAETKRTEENYFIFLGSC